MNDAPSLKQLNRTFIGSVLFIDIVGYSRCTVPDQLEMKELFNTLLAEAVQNVALSERIMVDTGDGAGIAFLGDPEDALFTALSLRDAVDTGKVNVGEPGFVRMGINLGPLKVVRDINGHTNMIGDGVNDAQRVMSFAEPGQVMVSHSYYDIISRFSRDYAQLFVYEGTRHDKHVREHEVYRFGPVEDNQGLAEKLRNRSRARQVSAADAAPAAPATTSANPAAAKPPREKTKTAMLLGQKTNHARTGLIATAIGAVTIVGAVWSWTSTPDKKSQAPSGMASASSPASDSAVAAKPSASVAATPAIASVASGSASASAAATSKSSETKSAAKASAPGLAQKPPPSASVPPKENTAAADKREDASAKTADSSAPASKPGTVKLAVQPWGEIYVDGGKRGISPPLKSLTLAPGKHRIEIRNSQFATYKETVEVKSGAEHTVQYVF